MAMDEKPPYLSVDSFDSFNSATSTTSSFEKLKKLGNRIRRKPLPRYLRGSIRMHPAAGIEPSRVGKGVWKDQLLIDRSIRGMAALMTLLAIGMIILIALYADNFRDRANSNTTDVYGTQNYGDVGRTWDTIQVHYDANCTDYLRTATDVALLERSYFYNSNIANTLIYGDGDCLMGSSVYCTIHDEKPGMCRLNVRMSAAFILAACLVLKATYMLSVNLLARGKLKSQCLTFGDVLVASASDPDLRVQGECMVNGGDNYRRHNTHTCHKHCRGVEDSKTGDELGHCQKCKKWNSTNMFSNEPQPTIATKFKRSLISNLGNTALTQMCLLMLCTLALVGASIAIAVPLSMANKSQKENCDAWSSNSETKPIYCSMSDTAQFEELSGGWGGFNRSLTAAALEPDSLSNEVLSFAISNGAQFIYSLLYLMMIYNITLISQEHTWGKLEYGRKRLRTTLVTGESFAQDYLLQLPKKILFPTMAYSVLTHWMLGEALQTQEAIWLENADGRHVEHSRYNITYAAYPVWTATFLSLLMTGVCWWAFTYEREGFIPQMYGSIRVLCAATTQLDDFPPNGIQWGDLGEGKTFRHAGLAAEEVMKIVPNALYAGQDPDAQDGKTDAGTLDEQQDARRRTSQPSEKGKEA
ncbi:hypothetical protein E8E11_004502 [Didymella keratinophila]|nr:hypothetical protein E8E11_004502 [Didymella keratinophila]